MATIGALIGRNDVIINPPHTLLPPGNIGIELEVEGRADWPDVNGWNKEADGSLRDGIEYVFDGPKGGAHAVRNIKAMARMIEENPVDNSFRCSTHIHLDVRDMDFEELRRLVIAYTMMEGVMFQHCSMDRRYSNFCTPFFLNTYLPRLFANSMKDPRDNNRIHHIGGWPKYTALNLKPLTSYGSVEFRGSHALVTEEGMMSLAQRMLHLKRVAMGMQGTALEFTEHLRNLRLDEIFPTGLAAGFMAEEKLLDQGYASAIGIATGNVARRRVPEYAPAVEPAGAAFRDVNVMLDQDALERYHLFPRTVMSLTELMRMVKGLREVQGLQRPDMFTFARTRNEGYEIFGGGGNTLAALRQLGFNGRDVGI